MERRHLQLPLKEQKLNNEFVVADNTQGQKD